MPCYENLILVPHLHHRLFTNLQDLKEYGAKDGKIFLVLLNHVMQITYPAIVVHKDYFVMC